MKNIANNDMNAGACSHEVNKSDKQACTYSVAVQLASLANSNSQESETGKNPQNKS